MTAGFSALVVDDDDFSRQTAARILKRLGAREVAQAADGKTALRIADELGDTIDLVLCDLKMPQFDGIETLGGIAARSRSATFVLASSADPRLLRAAAGTASRSGITALRVLSKPVTLAKMQEIVDALAQSRPEPLPQPQTPSSPSFSVDDIRRGLEAGEFTAFYQPKLDVRSRRVHGAEALIRWRNPAHGLLSPHAFIGVAQDNSLLADFFLVMLAEAAGHCAEWRRAGHDVDVSINLPVAVLASRDLPNSLEEFVAGKGLLPRHITFEVTEDGWLQHQFLAREVLTRLRIRGFGLAIDDFGTGYSGAQQLLDAPFNEMKIDASFVRHAPEDAEAAIVLASSIALARQLDLIVVAEGVETSAQWDLLQNAGCDQVQGYFVSRPLPFDQFVAWLQARLPVEPALAV